MAKCVRVGIGETATPERILKAGGVVSEFIDDETGRKRIRRERVYAECMIDHYKNTNRLDTSQCNAAYKFREIYQRVNYGFNTRVLNDLALVDGTRPLPDSKMITHLDCIKGIDQACHKLTAKQFEIIRNVCGYNEHAGTKEKLQTLRRGLDALATYWKI